MDGLLQVEGKSTHDTRAHNTMSSIPMVLRPWPVENTFPTFPGVYSDGICVHGAVIHVPGGCNVEIIPRPVGTDRAFASMVLRL